MLTGKYGEVSTNNISKFLDVRYTPNSTMLRKSPTEIENFNLKSLLSYKQDLKTFFFSQMLISSESTKTRKQN